MLEEYKRKRLEYNLAVNKLNKLNKDFNNKILSITKKEYEVEVKKSDKEISQLKSAMEEYFNNNEEQISEAMLKENSIVVYNYNFYLETIINDEAGKPYQLKKNHDQVNDDYLELRNKIQKKYDNKIITSIIFNDLNRCLDCYQKNILNKWKTLEKKKYLSIEEKKEILKKKKQSIKSENLLFKKLILPLIVIDIISLLFVIFTGTECRISDSESLFAFLCALTIIADLFLIFITPVIIIYLIVVLFKFLKYRKKSS